MLITGISDRQTPVGDIRIGDLKMKLPIFKLIRSFSEDTIKMFKHPLQKEYWNELLPFRIEEYTVDEKFEAIMFVIKNNFKLASPHNKIKENKPFKRVNLNQDLLNMREHLLRLQTLTRDLEYFHPLKITYNSLKK